MEFIDLTKEGSREEESSEQISRSYRTLSGCYHALHQTGVPRASVNTGAMLFANALLSSLAADVRKIALEALNAEHAKEADFRACLSQLLNACREE